MTTAAITTDHGIAATTAVNFIDPWLRLHEAAQVVHVSEATLRREIRRRALRCAKVGGRKSIRIRESWLTAWLERNSTPVEGA